MIDPRPTSLSASFSSVSFSLTRCTNICRISSSLDCISLTCASLFSSYVSCSLKQVAPIYHTPGYAKYLIITYTSIYHTIQYIPYASIYRRILCICFDILHTFICHTFNACSCVHRTTKLMTDYNLYCLKDTNSTTKYALILYQYNYVLPQYYTIAMATILYMYYSYYCYIQLSQTQWLP